MSEFVKHLRTDIDEYQDYVRLVRFQDTPGIDWKDQRATHISEEQIEFLTQHGAGSNLLLPHEFWHGVVRENFSEMFGDLRTLQNKMADEMGDLLWFAVDTIDRNGLSVSEVVASSLRKYTSDGFEINGFEDMDRVVEKYADAINVVPKFALENRLIDPSTNKYEFQTSVADHPSLLYLRMGSRVINALETETSQASMPAAVEMEPAAEINDSLGDLILVMAYIAKDRLDTSIQMIADFNVAKLDNRMRNDFDKTKDISFSDFRESFEYAL